MQRIKVQIKAKDKSSKSAKDSMKDKSIRKEKKAKRKKEQSNSNELGFKRKCLKQENTGIQVEANIQTSNVSPEDKMIMICQSEFTKLLDFVWYVLSNT